ncbi:hypothetical protein Tco_0138943 [Tanacetum coccineum]
MTCEDWVDTRWLSLVPILNSLRPFKQPYKPCSLIFVNRFAKNFGMVLDRLMIQTRLAVYKFEGDDLDWWKAYEQTKKFRWSFHKSILDHLMCILFIDIAQFADVAHNLEILHDTEDYDGSEQSGKKRTSRNIFYPRRRVRHLVASGAKPIAETPYRISPVKCDIYGVDKSSFHKFLDKFVIVLINDILIFTKSNEEHEDQPCTVIQIFQQGKLYTKFSKCKFWLSKVVFLGHVVLAEGITMDPAKVEAVTKWPRPTSETEARSFLGISWSLSRSYYSDSKIARIFQQEIVQLHGTPSAIVSDKDPRFTFRILETHARQEGYTNKLSRPLKLSAKLSCFLESIAYEWRQTFWYYRQDLFHQTIRNSRSRREISYRLAYLLSYHTFMMYFTCFVQKSQVSFLSRCLLSTRSDS